MALVAFSRALSVGRSETVRLTPGPPSRDRGVPSRAPPRAIIRGSRDRPAQLLTCPVPLAYKPAVAAELTAAPDALASASRRERRWRREAGPPCTGCPKAFR